MKGWKPGWLLGVMLAGLLPLAASAANAGFAGVWRLDTARSSALDGWDKEDVVIALRGTRVAITHRMQWRTTKLAATNTYDTAKAVEQKDFFRVYPRHMAVYPAKGGVTHATASWKDGGRTLRIETKTPVEVSQGVVPLRIYREYRLGELGRTLTLIELRSSRNRPLVYVFHRLERKEVQE